MCKHLLVSALTATSLLIINDAFEIEPRVYKGFSSLAGEFPFYALLGLSYNDRESLKMCGGSVISREWILTAAHCVVEIKQAMITLGLTEIAQFNNNTYTVVIKPDSIFVHENYVSPGGGAVGHDDIALIKLPKPIEFTETIQPIELPTSCQMADNVKAIAIGNGQVNSTHANSLILQWTPLTTVSMKECRKYWNFVGSRKTIVCARNEQKRSVGSGDSGGPLIRKNDMKLIGVTSFGRLDDITTGWPQGFTRITSYHRWISKVTGLKLVEC